MDFQGKRNFIRNTIQVITWHLNLSLFYLCLTLKVKYCSPKRSNPISSSPNIYLNNFYSKILLIIWIFNYFKFRFWIELTDQIIPKHSDASIWFCCISNNFLLIFTYFLNILFLVFLYLMLKHFKSTHQNIHYLIVINSVLP